jgi:hypothetical protein
LAGLLGPVTFIALNVTGMVTPLPASALVGGFLLAFAGDCAAEPLARRASR